MALKKSTEHLEPQNLRPGATGSPHSAQEMPMGVSDFEVIVVWALPPGTAWVFVISAPLEMLVKCRFYTTFLIQVWCFRYAITCFFQRLGVLPVKIFDYELPLEV